MALNKFNIKDSDFGCVFYFGNDLVKLWNLYVLVFKYEATIIIPKSIHLNVGHVIRFDKTFRFCICETF